MYSSLDEESVYFVVRTGQGETLPYRHKLSLPGLLRSQGA